MAKFSNINLELDAEIKKTKLKTAEDYIMFPFLNWVAKLRNKKDIDYLAALIQGKTGQGKTHLTAHKMIPHLFNNGDIKLAVVSAPNYGILNIEHFKNSMSKNFGDGKVKVVDNFTDAKDFLLSGKKVVLVTIHHQLIAPAGKNFMQIMNTFARNKYAIFIDEAHSWLVPDWTLYKDSRGHSSSPKSYKASLYRLLEGCETNYQFWLTATPTNVQSGKILYNGKLQCKVINELPPKNLTIDKLAYLNSVEYYNIDLGEEWCRNKCEYGGTTIEKLVLAKLKEMREFQLETGIKKTMIIRTGGTNAKEFMCHPAEVRRMVDRLVLEAGYDKRDKIYGITNQSGVTLESVSGCVEILDDDMDLQRRMDDPYDPVTIMLVIDKCYQGMSVNSLKTVVVWRVTTQEDTYGEPILDFGVQVVGRGSRLFACYRELNDHSFDSLKHLSLEEKKMIVEANGVDVILPDTSQAREVGRILSDVVLCSKEEFEEYFLEDSKKISFNITANQTVTNEEEICDQCGASSKYWNKDIIDSKPLNIDEIDKVLLAAE